MEYLLVRSAVALLLSSVISAGALRRKSLDLSGALSGFLVMAIHITCSYRLRNTHLLLASFSSNRLVLALLILFGRVYLKVWGSPPSFLLHFIQAHQARREEEEERRRGVQGRRAAELVSL
ncbi:hypothetical protein MA16_Dca025440 [Dendrobium catenatum]|uniref:Uncharacterized protein n=1 Tax=Dendrobium catenatum TaxID=906689 RepID=A0A2I0VQR4_9ASPA|nr:hypothetical protein MA16_Dca025440 [Dendrobium catenatum]